MYRRESIRVHGTARRHSDRGPHRLDRLGARHGGPGLLWQLYWQVLFTSPFMADILTTAAGGDLVLKELGVRIAFPSGSNCHLRGQGLHHLISSYEGIRHSLVLTNKESVRRTASSLDDFSKQERARAAKLESKNPKDWSDDENKLHQAHKEGRNAMLEYAWDQIKESSNQEKREKAREKEAKRKEADNSKQDHLEEPPKKTAKTTKTAS